MSLTIDDLYDEEPAALPSRRSFGILGLDLLTRGGMPIGGICEIVGKEHSGKSTVAYCATATAQQAGGTVGWIAVSSQSYVPEYAKSCGVRAQGLLLMVPDTKELALELAATCSGKDGMDLVILEDFSRGVHDGETADEDRMAQSIGKHDMRKLATAADAGHSTLLLTTETDFHWVQTHPFWVQQRLGMVERSSDETRAYLLSDALGYVGQGVIIPLRPTQGVDHVKHVLQLGSSLGVVEKRNAHYSYAGIGLGQGSRNAVASLQARQDLLGQILAAVLTKDASRAFVPAR